MPSDASAYEMFQARCAEREAAEPGLSRSRVERLVFSEWVADQRWDDLIAYCLEAFDPGGGDWELLELSHHLFEAAETARVDRLWQGVIAQRAKRLKARRRVDTAKLRAELAEQYGPPLETYYGPLDVHFRRHHAPRAAEDALSWAIMQYERAILGHRNLSDLLDDEALRARHERIHGFARELIS